MGCEIKDNLPLILAFAKIGVKKKKKTLVGEMETLGLANALKKITLEPLLNIGFFRMMKDI